MKTTTNVANNPIWQNLSLENLSNEIWKPVKDCDGLYEVSSMGNLKAISKPKWGGRSYYNTPTKIMKKSVGKNGYEVVRISQKTQYVHRIVAFSFLSNSEFFGLDVNHINGIKTDNRVENLEWCDRKFNINHSFKIGLSKKGEDRKSSTITEDVAMEIIKIHKQTGLGKSLLQRHHFPNVSLSCLQGITNNKTWKHLPR